MRKSLRAKRMAKHHRRNKASTKLNLVSLMDIFTILVFFLLVNSSDVEVLQQDKTIKLPESVAEQKPDNTLVIVVNSSNIVIGGRVIASVDSVIKNRTTQITELRKELVYRATKRPVLSEAEKSKGRPVTIMGDKSIPYTLLKKIMATCAANDYRDISLAVSKVKNSSVSEQEG